MLGPDVSFRHNVPRSSLRPGVSPAASRIGHVSMEAVKCCKLMADNSKDASATSTAARIEADGLTRAALVLIVGIVLVVLLSAVFSGFAPVADADEHRSGFSSMQVLTEEGCFTFLQGVRLQDLLFGSVSSMFSLLMFVGSSALLPSATVRLRRAASALRVSMLIVFPIVILGVLMHTASSCYPVLVDAWPFWRINRFAVILMVILFALTALLPLRRRPGAFELIGALSVRAAQLLALALVLPLPWFEYAQPTELQIELAFGLAAAVSILWLLRSVDRDMTAASGYWVPVFLVGGIFYCAGLIALTVVIKPMQYLFEPLTPISVLLIVPAMLALPGRVRQIADRARRVAINSGRLMISASLVGTCFLPLMRDNPDLMKIVFLGGVISLFLAYAMIHVTLTVRIRLPVIVLFLFGYLVLALGLCGPTMVLGVSIHRVICITGALILASSFGLALRGLVGRHADATSG